MSRYALLDQVVELASDYYDRRDTSPVFPHITPDELRRTFGAGSPVPEQGQSAEKVIADLAETAGRVLVAQTGPQYFGFVIGGSLPVTMSLMTAALSGAPILRSLH